MSNRDPWQEAGPSGSFSKWLLFQTFPSDVWINLLWSDIEWWLSGKWLYLDCFPNSSPPNECQLLLSERIWSQHIFSPASLTTALTPAENEDFAALYWSCYKPLDAENFILLALLGSTNLHIKVQNYSGFEFVYEVNLNLNHASIYYK